FIDAPLFSNKKIQLCKKVVQ
ncbi:DNA-binding response regulator, partial [Bacillus cereus]|nr:DNA-binding response regulator [Bacillus cereus]